MDFTGSIINEFRGLPDFWWLWLIIAAVGGGLIWILLAKIKEKKINRRDVVICGLLTAYVVFILMETVIGRKPGIRRYELIPFWSYADPEHYLQIFLNYILFIPFGILVYILLGRKLGLKVVFIGILLSFGIELSQLFFKIGLFEFDDIFGNTIGCLIGATIVKVCVKH